MQLRVQVGAVTFWGLTDDGFLIGPDGFKGWDDSTPTKRQVVARPQAHGSFAIRGFRDSRVVTLSGTCFTTSEQRLSWYGSQLTGLLADGDVGRITVEHSGVTTYADCYLDGDTTFDMISAGAAATFQVQFWCPDPWKFGDAHTFAGGVPAFHYGNAIAAPVLTVSGDSSTGYTIYGPDGKQFVVTIPLVSGHSHVIDMATGYLTVDGLIVTGAVAQADTWGIPGGAQVTMTVSVGTLSALVVDTYV